MTNHNESNEEERLIMDKMLGARNELEIARQAARTIRDTQNRIEKYLSDCEQAVIDYMQANGLKQFTACNCSCTLGSTHSVDIADPDAVPSAYMREKVVKEPNKPLIAELHKAGALPDCNWFKYTTTNKITIKAKEA